jgi:hypothetical protein
MPTFKKPELAALLVRTTHHVDTGDGKRATIYYESEHRAHMRRPDGVVMTGDWSLLDDGYRVDWQGGPSGTWALRAEPGRISYIDAEGQERGTVQAIEFGHNASFSA